MRPLQPELEVIIKRISLDECIPVEIVRAVVVSQFEFLRSNMKQGHLQDLESYQVIRLPFLGKFVPSISKIKRAKHIKHGEEREEHQDREAGGDSPSNVSE